MMGRLWTGLLAGAMAAFLAGCSNDAAMNASSTTTQPSTSTSATPSTTTVPNSAGIQVLATYSAGSPGDGWLEWPDSPVRVVDDLDALWREWDVAANWSDGAGNTEPPMLDPGTVVLVVGNTAGALGLGTPRIDAFTIEDGVLIVDATSFTGGDGCLYAMAIDYQMLIVSLDGVGATPDMRVDVRWVSEPGEPC